MKSEIYVSCGSNTVCINKNPLKLKKGCLDKGNIGVVVQNVKNWTVFMLDEDILGYHGGTWVRINKRNDGLTLDHLESPKKGEGFGKLGLALFWAVLMKSGAERFAIRFGGGEKSEEFLRHLGFPEKYFHRINDKQTKGEYSIAIGNVNKKDKNTAKNLKPIPTRYYPTNFFKKAKK